MPSAPRFSPAEQESLILKAAAEVIEQSSLMGFTMSAIAKTAGISMGSIYKHVQSKEDVLIALDVMLLQRELAVEKKLTHEKLTQFSATTPEKLIAMSLVDTRKTNLYPFDTQLDMLVGNDAIISRGSPAWVGRMQHACREIGEYLFGVLKQSVESGELSGPEDMDTEIMHLILGMWALDVGNKRVSLASSTGFLPASEIGSPQICNTKRFINSFDWRKPLDDEGIKNVCKLLEEAELR